MNKQFLKFDLYCNKYRKLLQRVVLIGIITYKIKGNIHNISFHINISELAEHNLCNCETFIFMLPGTIMF